MTSGLQCYKCSYDISVTTDKSCVTGNFPADTDSVETCTSATKCYTKRTVYSASNEINSVSRGCDEGGEKMDHCTRAINGKETCTTVCDGGELCNADNQKTILNDIVWCYSCVETYNIHINQTCLSEPTEQDAFKCYSPRTCYITSLWSPDK